jgi:hypothetical protein
MRTHHLQAANNLNLSGHWHSRMRTHHLQAANNLWAVEFSIDQTLEPIKSPKVHKAPHKPPCATKVWCVEWVPTTKLENQSKEQKPNVIIDLRLLKDDRTT